MTTAIDEMIDMDQSTYDSLEDLKACSEVHEDVFVPKVVLMAIANQLDQNDKFETRVTTDYSEHGGADLGVLVRGTRRFLGGDDLTEVSIYELEEPDADNLYGEVEPSYTLAYRSVTKLQSHFWIRTSEIYKLL